MIDIKINKLTEKSIVGDTGNGYIPLTALELLTEVGKDGRLVLIYRSGISVNIPEGYIGLITPTRLSPIYSLDDAAGIQVVNANDGTEVIGRYKINSNSVPAVFEVGEEFARIYVVEAPEMSISVEDFVNEEEKEEHEGETENAASGVQGEDQVSN